METRTHLGVCLFGPMADTELAGLCCSARFMPKLRQFVQKNPFYCLQLILIRGVVLLARFDGHSGSGIRVATVEKLILVQNIIECVRVSLPAFRSPFRPG